MGNSRGAMQKELQALQESVSASRSQAFPQLHDGFQRVIAAVRIRRIAERKDAPRKLRVFEAIPTGCDSKATAI